MASKKMLQGEEECKKQNKQGRRETRKNVVLSATSSHDHCLQEMELKIVNLLSF
jgi:hypothetical protein